ncbi:MAG: alcohol dehydrogenase [Myxococcota bacterium]
MKITRYEAASYGGPITPQVRELPDPTGTEVLVEISHCGVCHTDVHVHHGSYDLGAGRSLSFAERGIQPPLVLGHEIVGRPVASGPNAEVELNTPHAVYPWIGCGGCGRCEQGLDHLCAQGAFLGVFRPGGYATHVLVPHPRYLFSVDGLDPASAALFGCSGLTCFSALQRIAAVPKDAAIAVIGCGGLGLTAIALARQLGRNRIVAVDPAPDKRALATAAGACAALDSTALDASAMNAASGAPILAVLDFVGSEASSSLATEAMAKGGTLVVIGLFGGELRYPLPLLPIRALTIVGSYVGSPKELGDYIAHVRRYGAPQVPVFERSFDEAGEVLSELARGEIPGRAVLVHSKC